MKTGQVFDLTGPIGSKGHVGFGWFLQADEKKTPQKSSAVSTAFLLIATIAI